MANSSASSYPIALWPNKALYRSAPPLSANPVPPKGSLPSLPTARQTLGYRMPPDSASRPHPRSPHPAPKGPVRPGFPRRPKIEFVLKVADYFGVTTDQLVRDDIELDAEVDTVADTDETP